MVRIAGFAALVLAVACFAGVQAAEQDKEVKLTGKITCAKCELKVKDLTKCTATVIVVKDKDKDVVYYFDKAAHGKNHGEVCEASKEGSVTGVTSKDGDKNIITVKTIEFKK